MGLLGSKEKRKVRKSARTKKTTIRKKARKTKKTARKKAGAEKKSARQESREEKKTARKKKRKQIKKIRKSGTSKSQKKAKKQAVRKQARKTVRASNQEKQAEKKAARKTVRQTIKKAKTTKQKGVAKVRAHTKEHLKRAVDPSFGSTRKFVPGVWKKFGKLANRFASTKSSSVSPGASLASLVKRCQADTLAEGQIEAGLLKFFRCQAITGNFAKNPLKHPARLAFARKEGKLTGTFGRTWIYPVPYDLDKVELVFRKKGGKGKAGVTFCKFAPTGKEDDLWTFGVAPGTDDDGRVWKKTFSGVQGCLLAVVVDGKSVAKSIEYELRLKRPDQGRISRPAVKSKTRRVEGFADVHAHHMSHYGFAGAMIAPDPFGPLDDCDGKHAHFISKLVMNMHKAGDRKVGNKAGWEWPVHDDMSHQPMHANYLKEAMRAAVTRGAHGLRLMISPSVNNMYAAHLVAHKDGDIPLNDMDAIRLQLKAHHAFADKYSWYEIAHDPWEARRIIRRGHLAVILSVECSHLMPKSHGEWRDQLDELYDLGARAMQLSHETDTRFAGAAFQHGKLFKWKHLFTKVSWAQMDPDMREQLKATRIRVDALQRAEKYRRLSTNDPRARNPLGITPEGFQLVEEMAKKNMILEIDHCSRLGRKQLYDRVRSSKAPKHLRWYPLNYSHSRIDELMPSRAWMEKEFGKAAVKDNVDKTKESTGWDGNYTTMEYMSTVKESKYVIPTGGIFGIRTGPNAQVKSRGSGVENRCHTSSRSLAQIVAELDKAGIAVSLGTDFAGFTAMTAARFERRKKDWTRKEEYAATGMPNQKPDKYGGDAPPVKRGNRLSEFNFLGLAHIGLTPDLLQDFENLGLDVRGLRGSAEATLRMWERCHDPKRQEMTPAQYRKRMITEVAAGVK